jgi:hypothetical protein
MCADEPHQFSFLLSDLTKAVSDVEFELKLLVRILSGGSAALSLSEPFHSHATIGSPAPRPRYVNYQPRFIPSAMMIIETSTQIP